jgi:hypothetical protein
VARRAWAVHRAWAVEVHGVESIVVNSSSGNSWTMGERSKVSNEKSSHKALIIIIRIYIFVNAKGQVELVDIKVAIQTGKVRITDHAYEEANADSLKFDEIYFSALNGVVIEEYQDDSPFPSVLIFGQTFGGDPVHSVWAYNEKKQWAVLITVYRPDPNLWIDCKLRKR